MSAKSFECKWCGKPYKSYKENSKFCSNDCKTKYRESLKYECDNCGKPFIVVESKLNDLKNGKHKHLFCSRKCANEFQKTAVTKKCEQCGKEYEICYSFKDIQKFCSRKCYDDYRNEHSVIIHKECPSCYRGFDTYHKDQIYCSKECAGKAQQNRVDCECEYCGKPFERIKSEYDKNKRHYCSKECKILDNAWIHEDIEKLKKYYGKVSKEEITKIISDKWDYEAIRRKAQWLGLTQSNLWTQKEIQTLLDTYSKYPVNHILKLLPNKTYASILGQARKQNLLSYFYLTNTYSKEEEQFIRDNYLIMTDEEIGEKLNRTPYAISQRIYKLNLHRPLEKHNYGTLNNYMRAKLTMWKQRYREKCNYTCALSGSHSNIIVHHIYGFNLLMLETIELLNFPLYEDLDLYSQDELDLFVKTFLDLQEYYGEYICITENIHKKFHSIYGYGNNTREQWDEFVNNYYITNQKIS